MHNIGINIIVMLNVYNTITFFLEPQLLYHYYF